MECLVTQVKFDPQRYKRIITSPAGHIQDNVDQKRFFRLAARQKGSVICINLNKE
jgi:hypothetical protein